MNSYEEIKQLLKKKDFQSALLLAFSNSLKFKLTTKIGDQHESSSIETTIDLLKGVTNTVSDSSCLENQNKLIKFHRSQLENVHDIWDTNRQIIVAILKVLANNDEVDSSNLKTSSFSATSLTTSELEPDPDHFEHNVNDIVDLMLEDNDEEDDFINTIDQNEEDEEIIATVQKTADESWSEFMDGLSAEEEAVTEKVIVNEAPSDQEIDDWSEWVIENEDENEKINWTEEDWQEEEEIISNS